MNTTLIAYLNTLPAGSIWAGVILALVLAPWITRARSRVQRIARVFSWIGLGFVMGVMAVNFPALTLPLRGL